ncbi:MAG: M3 family oligoendopeptidase [Alphaproteobacteria bacterium]|nr:M3 family oligoendopeptidase [Alphaproteobacteria bacterium]
MIPNRQPAEQQAADNAGADLPVWDLSDLYRSMDDPAIERDLSAAADGADKLIERGKGKLAAMDGAVLAAFIRDYETIEELLGRIYSYASLLHAAKSDDAEISRFFQTVRERINDIGTKLLFVTLEINRIDDADLEAKVGSAEGLSYYRPWLRDVRSFRPHQLDDEIERVLHEKSITGRAAWNRLFDETMARIRFPLDGKDLTSAEIFDILSDKDRSKREAAGKAVAETLESQVSLFALITNTLAKDKQIEDDWRKFQRPISSRNLANQVEDEVVDALISATKDAYPRLAHRYYQYKAKWMGLDKLEYWDRNAPLPEDSDKRIAWDDAKVIVLDAYRGFSPELADIVDRFFTDRWIDAPPRPGKDAGAFCHPTVPSAHPYVLMNYQGRPRDVMTLAHELGHGVHQVLAGRQGPLMAGTPLTLAETASVFGEQLTFQSVLKAESDPVQRRLLLAGKVEDALNTVVRQIAFVDFERRVHDARQNAELTPDELGKIWMDVQTESLGPAFHFEDGYRVFWSYIPHFIHVPFYVYAYAFGDCLVNSLYAVYQAEPDGFQERYHDLLAAGGTLRHKELLAPFGLDATDPTFWSKGLGVIESLIDRLEQEAESTV